MKSSFLSLRALAIFHFSAVASATTCYDGLFFVWQGIHSDGVITETISENVRVSSCERICRLYTNCVGFNVNWTDSEQEMGFCRVTESKLLVFEMAFYGELFSYGL